MGKTCTESEEKAGEEASAKQPRNKGGRPRNDRHAQDFLSLGEPPEDLLRLADWVQELVALTAWQARTRRGARQVRGSLRAGALALAKLFPAALTADAQGMLAGADINHEGPPPKEPLLRVVWLLRVLAWDLWDNLQELGQRTGREVERAKVISRELRAAAKAMARILPPDVQVEARRVLAEQAKEIKVEQAGAELAPLPAGRPVSVNVAS